MHYHREINLSTGEGWHKLIIPLIDAVLDAGGSIHQIKEKFGGLRFYYGFDKEIPNEVFDRINNMVNLAEDQSYHICENCGKPGETRSNHYWLKTLCDSCENDRDEERKKWDEETLRNRNRRIANADEA
jgi:hypothetical protein